MLETNLKSTRTHRNKGKSKTIPVRNQSAGYDHLYKVMVIGDSGVGKTSLINRFTDDSFSESFTRSIGIDFKNRTLQVEAEGESKRVRLQVWDTEAEDRFRDIHNAALYRGVNIQIFVCDVTDRESFNNLQIWLRKTEDYESSNPPVKIIVGNKTDLKSKRVVSDEEIQELADQHACFATTTSAKTSYNSVEEVFEFAAEEYLARQINQRAQVENQESIQVKQTSKPGPYTSKASKSASLEEEWLNSPKHKREIQNFENIWNNPDYNTNAKKIAAVLNDYAMDDSFLARVFTGHWRRHHCYDVNLIAKSIEHNLVKNPDNIESVLKKLDRIPLDNNYGTLATLKLFLTEKQEDSPQNREKFEL